MKFRAPGYSMYPTLLHDDVITVEPVKPGAIRVGDIILYQDQESLIAHRVVQIENKSDSRSSVLSLPRRSHAFSATKTGPRQSAVIMNHQFNSICGLNFIKSF